MHADNFLETLDGFACGVAFDRLARASWVSVFIAWSSADSWIMRSGLSSIRKRVASARIARLHPALEP